MYKRQASVFLKGLVSVAEHCVDIVYTQNDLKTLPNFHSMPMSFFPYVTSMRNVFLDGGETYQGNADLAVNAGFLNGADLSDAEHGIYYAWSGYRDAMRRYKEENRLKKAAEGTRELEQGVHLGERALVIDSITETAQNGDYRKLAGIFDAAMKEWGILPEGTGYVDGKLISDTGEICFDPDHARYTVHTPSVSYTHLDVYKRQTQDSVRTDLRCSVFQMFRIADHDMIIRAPEMSGHFRLFPLRREAWMDPQSLIVSL